MDETIPVKCGPLVQDISREKAQMLSDALARFLADPENTKTVDPSLHSRVIAPRSLYFDVENEVIMHGGWTFECAGPDMFFWRNQPIAQIEYSAFLGFDDRDELWKVVNFRVKKMRR